MLSRTSKENSERVVPSLSLPLGSLYLMDTDVTTLNNANPKRMNSKMVAATRITRIRSHEGCCLWTWTYQEPTVPILFLNARTGIRVEGGEWNPRSHHVVSTHYKPTRRRMLRWMQQISYHLSQRPGNKVKLRTEVQ